jgi:hypothetical protein
MKKLLLLFTLLLLAISCQKAIIEKPAKLIAEDKMINILFDISVLEAIKQVNPTALTDRKITTSIYIYKKYQIDSLQFAQNDKYYASDVKNYAKMYDEVAKRIDDYKIQLDTEKSKNPTK